AKKGSHEKLEKALARRAVLDKEADEFDAHLHDLMTKDMSNPEVPAQATRIMASGVFKQPELDVSGPAFSWEDRGGFEAFKTHYLEHLGEYEKRMGEMRKKRKTDTGDAAQ
ncbi:unnamed protein product, partial [Prorocentrum cordatum]